MSETKRLTSRREKLQELLTTEEGLKSLYRFSAQNPHINLHDGCQIIMERPNASVCFSFEEWNAMDRRITRGRRGIPYYDSDGHKHFVFDATDTHGGMRYQRLAYPMKRLLAGLDLLNGTSLEKDERADYRKIKSGVASWLKENDYLTEDNLHNSLWIEGVSYSLYTMTGFPKNNGIRLTPMPFMLKPNADLFKEIYITTSLLQQEVETAYLAAQETVQVVDDVEEESLSDEIPEEEISYLEVQEEKPKLPLYYERYLALEEKYPEAIVIQQMGDFYEVMGKNAQEASNVLELTLTGRDVGLPERVAMCGFPYHVKEVYIEKLTKHSAVVVQDAKGEERYIAKAEAKIQEPNEDFFAEFEEIEFTDEEDLLEQLAEEEKPKAKVKGIKDRKRKSKPVPTLFDLIEPKETEEEKIEQMIKRQLIQGSGFALGKFRIVEAYQKNPTQIEFAEQLKAEYGVGSYGGLNGDSQSCNAKGISMQWVNPNDKSDFAEADLTWSEVAIRIADLIDDKEYLTEEETKIYADILRKREERINATSVAEKIKVIVHQTIEEGTKSAWNVIYEIAPYRFEESAEFFKEHREEIESALLQEAEVKTSYPTAFPYADHIKIEFYPEYVKRLKTKPEESVTENTDLNEVGIAEEELGGAKTRFKNNVEAIRLLNTLYQADRMPTTAEKKILAKYVGWGGLAQAFDERNEQWQKEFSELKDLLSNEDYALAKASVLNAHYTSKEVIDGIYKGLSRFGVKGNNRILEPALGTGNFFGYMPQEMLAGSKLYGVELDRLTGKIATKLYPEAKIQIKGFEATSFPDEHFNLVVTNVPFGGYGVFDSAYNKYNFLVHDYFIAKSIDKLKPNGVMAVITSKGTMDKLSPVARKYYAERAELLGAIRLPNTAFKKTAGTEAVADILFFRKREERLSDVSDIEWLKTGTTEEGYEINQYFIEHPEMILGTLTKEVGLYGAEDITVNPDGRSLSEALEEAIQTLPANFYQNPEEEIEEETSTIEADYTIKPLCYKAENGKLYMRLGDEMVEQEIPKSPKDAYSRIKEMIALRDNLLKLLNLQIEGCDDETLKEEQRHLNFQYDSFVRRYGIINSQTNIRLFKDDGDSALLFACENLSEDKKTATKADIFIKRTIRPYAVATHTDDAFEALQISMNERGKVDIAYAEELTGKDYDTVIAELGQSVFRNPLEVNPEDKYSGFELAEKYLSGNVSRKLVEAKEAVREYPELGYAGNVEALEEVQPVPLTASEISVRVGASWVDKKYYLEFLSELLNIPYYYARGLDIYYNPHDSSYRIDKTTNYMKSYRTQRMAMFGTARASVFRLFEDCLNLRATSIYDTIQTDDGEKRVLNHEETVAAREKQNQLKTLFQDWIFDEPERREELEATYNSLFNQTRIPAYDGSYLKFPEMNPAIELKPHQKNAVHRIITSGNTLLHHVVGAGKTYTICAAAMKLRQYGLAKKPMIAVPNHLVQQWAKEFRQLYPRANLLIATKEDLEKENRQRFVSKVALGDWDAVIIAQSSFAKIPISPERQIAKIEEEIEKIEETIQAQIEEGNGSRGAIKNLERIKKSRETALKKLMDDTKKDNVLIFEKLGVDYLFIDEAHYYKNLFLYTKMNNVAGVSTTASQRASDLKLKCEYINELHGSDKGVVFATGTPISNSMTEMYTMQTYLQKLTLDEVGIPFFDSWAANFGETITSLELAPSGRGYKAKTRFAKFTNLPELLTMYRSFADVQTKDMVKLDVPEVDRKVVTLKPSDTVLELADEIAERAEKINGGGVDPRIDNMLKVTTDGKKLALDPRLIDHMAASEDTSKLNACATNIREIWEDTSEIAGTQIVFCDLSTPKKAFTDYEYGKDFDVYNDLKFRLVEAGIPEEEIAFIHEANSDLQKQALFDKVNAGKVRVLIGSTEKCGAGTNIQKRLIALHHLDTPYRPSDLQQREGRIIRHGNTNHEVKVFTYVMERTFDSYCYQILENKQRFIAQIDRGDLTVREAEDIDETTLSYAEIKAITAANPRIKRKMEVDTEVSRLRILEGQYKKNLYGLQDKVRKQLPEQINRQELYLDRIEKDIERIKERYNPEVFTISVVGKIYTDKKEGSKAFTDTLYASKPETIVAEYGGFHISMNPMVLLTAERTITLKGDGEYVIDIGSSASGNIQRLDNFLTEFASRKDKAIAKLTQLKADLEEASAQLDIPFSKKEELEELLKEQAQLNAELNLSKKEEVIIADEEEENKRGVDIMERSGEIEPILDETDKVAAMVVSVNPDYTISKEAMHSYGYTWDGMLPIKDKQIAKQLFENGVQLFTLTRSDSEYEVKESFELEEADVIFGVEKPVWNDWIHTRTGQSYLSARLSVAKSAEQGIRKEMSDMDERFTIAFIESNFEEIQALQKCVKEAEIGQSKPYLQPILEEFTERLSGTHLKQYGWDKSDVRDMLIKYIEPEELRNFAKQYARIRNYPPIYYESAGYAYDNAEVEAYKISRIANADCRNAIEDSIRKNYDGMRLKTDFIEELVNSFGEERLSYICASTIQESMHDGRYSKANKEWAETIQVNASKDERRLVWLNIHPAVLDGFVSSFRKKLKEKETNQEEENKELEQKNYEQVTANGYKVRTILEDVNSRSYVIFQRENDYGIGLGYDLKTGQWAQGVYDFTTIEKAEKYLKEYIAKVEPYQKREWLKVNVSKNALIKTYDKHSFMRMPDTATEYKDYTYNIFNSRIKETTQLVDLQSDGRELCYQLLVEANEEIVLKNKKGEEKILTGTEFASLVSGSSNADYKVKPEEEAKRYIVMSVPKEAMLGMYENASLFLLPQVTETPSATFYLPNSFIKEDIESEEGRIEIRLPEDFSVNAKDRDTEKEFTITAYQLYKRMDNTKTEDYARTTNVSSEETNGWSHTRLPEDAFITNYENRSMFKMPNGKYGGMCYYIPNKLFEEARGGGYKLSLPEEFEIKLKDGENDRTISLSVEEFLNEVNGKTAKDYEADLSKPSTFKKKFAKYADKLANNIPEEMKEKPNWVIVRTKYNEDKDRLEKFMISPITGKFAESDQPDTWTDFYTASEYAYEHGGTTLAFVLDGTDGLACVDLDHCFEENGDMTPLAKEVFDKMEGSYTERSVSGQGLHIFGRTKGMDLRTFSSTEDIEFYQHTHFIALTGDDFGSKEIKSFDTPEMKAFLESKLNKRVEWAGQSKGVAGLTSMTDREVVEKACASKYGDTFKALYDGEDIQNNHSNSDMCLMNRLAFWCNGDREQMLRIFATSGLYRSNKSASYYEHTATKAVRDTTSRFQREAPKQVNPTPSTKSTFAKE